MMRRVALVLLAVLLAVSFSGVTFAQSTSEPSAQTIFQQKLGKAKTMNFEGTVLSHDVGCHCIVLKTSKGNLTLQDDYAKFEGDYDRAKGLKIGQKYGGTYKTVDYINYALDIHEAK
jgi:hypothetical protein